MMGELQFFLMLHIKQAKEGTFVHQAKYTKDIFNKFKMDDLKLLSTLMRMTTTLDADEDGEPVDQKEYQNLIGSLLYLTAMRPDIQFSVCLCARFQASPRTSHRQAFKGIFKYLRYTPGLGLCYSASSLLSLHGFRMPTLRGVESIGSRLRGLASFWDLRLFLGLLANSLVQLSLPQKPNMLLLLVVAHGCFESHTLSDFGEECTHVPLMSDSTRAISIAKNPVLRSVTKHIEVRYHFLREC
jgi:hypothetical protein